MIKEPLLKVMDLDVSFGYGKKEILVVRGISFEINKGEIVGLVGESGSGKSITALSILKLLPYPLAHHRRGEILFLGDSDSASHPINILKANENLIQKIRGNRISMIFQDPLSCLNPLHSIEHQISEPLYTHKGMNRKQTKKRVSELLDLVGFPEGIKRLGCLPHEFSGGQQQRIMIAMALANEPDLLIADEPTTALDVTIQAQILQLLKTLNRKMNMAVFLITHDLEVIKHTAGRVIVMHDGIIVEENDTERIFTSPEHSYTRMLLSSVHLKGPDKTPESDKSILQAKHVKVCFPVRRGLIKRTVGHIKAVEDISFVLKERQTLAIVGESGSGKSTLARALIRLEKSSGDIFFQYTNIQKLKTRELRSIRRNMQIVFQDPFGSLSPRMSIGQILEEGLRIHFKSLSPKDRREKIEQALVEVGLDIHMQDRFPHQFSGGQRQRISIARAIVLKPKLIILDEPTSALDVSVQSQIIDLLKKLQREYQVSYIFISHDLRVVKAIAHHVLVLRNGSIVESGPLKELFLNPCNAYTRDLFSAAFHFNTSLELSGLPEEGAGMQDRETGH